MPVKLRLQRMGRKHHAFFRIVAADARSPRDGRFIEKIGSYDPHKEFEKYELSHEAALRWLQHGAQPTETVRTILSDLGVMLKYHLMRQGKSAEEVDQAYQSWLNDKTRKAESQQHVATKSKAEKAAAALAQEQKVREDRAKKISARLADAAQAAADAAKAVEAEASGEEAAAPVAEEEAAAEA
ncbi:MAG: 30S ribosomal protein S16 [Bacteroidetes bacterium]|nr:30S ribosomal protein S16 [Bacteroidota bacterium]